MEDLNLGKEVDLIGWVKQNSVLITIVGFLLVIAAVSMNSMSIGNINRVYSPATMNALETRMDKLKLNIELIEEDLSDLQEKFSNIWQNL